MRLRPLPAALLLACACVPAAGAQNVVRPGDGVLAAGAIRQGTGEFDVLSWHGGGWPIGEMTLRTRLATVDGVPALVRTETMWVDDALVQLDSFTLDARTLAPLRMRSSIEGRTVSLEFGAGTLRSVTGDGWDADSADVPLPDPVFLGGTTDLLLGALPLDSGYTARLAVYDADEGVGDLEVEVEAAEEVETGPGRRVAAWRVRVLHAGAPATYWMDRESHTLVQFESAESGIRIVRSRGGRSPARPTR